jgi:CheY-like chemotaxis protein
MADQSTNATAQPFKRIIKQFRPQSGEIKLKMLYVEDDEVLADIFISRFREFGYSGVYTTDGITALKLAKHDPFDVIITGIMMPRMDGMELLQKLKKNKTTKDVPVIMCTNLENNFIVEEAKRSGAEEYWFLKGLTPRTVKTKSDQIADEKLV